MIKDNKWFDNQWNPITGGKDEDLSFSAQSYCGFSGDVRRNINNPNIEVYESNKFILNKPIKSSVKKHYIDSPCGKSLTLHTYRFSNLTDIFKEKRNLLVAPMSDMFASQVPYEWQKQVLDLCRENEQHNYLFVTQHLENVFRTLNIYSAQSAILPENLWFGLRIIRPDFLNSLGFPGDRWIEQWVSKLKDRFQNIHIFLYLDLMNESEVGEFLTSAQNFPYHMFDWIFSNVDIDAFAKLNFWSPGRRKLPEELVHEIRHIGKNKKRLMSNCRMCDKEYFKADMMTIGSFHKRNEGYKTIGHICMTCYEQFIKTFKGE